MPSSSGWRTFVCFHSLYYHSESLIRFVTDSVPNFYRQNFKVPARSVRILSLNDNLQSGEVCSCEGSGMRISISKSEAMILCQKRVEHLLQVVNEFMPQVEFKYLRSEWRIQLEIDRWISAEFAVTWMLYWSVVVKKHLSMKAKLSVYRPLPHMATTCA